MIVIRRQTVLAEARHGRVATARVVRVGLSAADATAAAAAAAASEVPGTTGAPTPEEMLKKLTEAIACLKKDVALDACSEWYGTECEGSDPEVDRVAACLKKIEMGKVGELTPITWQDALTCAGVETSDENKEKFAACVKVKETDWHSIPRGTLAFCAMAVRRGIAATGALAHSTLAWRNGFETWANTFEVFRLKWETGSAGEVGVYAAATGIPMSEVARYAASYNTFREQFVDAGGTTSCEAIETPGGRSWIWWAVGGAVVLAVVSVVLWQIKTVAALTKGAA